MKTKPKQKPAPKWKITKPDDPEQSERFVETAREIEADESGEAFRRAFEKIVPTKSRSDS